MNLFAVLGVFFVVLKLFGVIAWSWWLVLLPFYGLILLFLIAVVFGLSILGILSAIFK